MLSRVCKRLSYCREDSALVSCSFHYTWLTSQHFDNSTIISSLYVGCMYQRCILQEGTTEQTSPWGRSPRHASAGTSAASGSGVGRTSTCSIFRKATAAATTKDLCCNKLGDIPITSLLISYSHKNMCHPVYRMGKKYAFLLLP